MGTNFYLHLGKRSAAAGGDHCRFTWAVGSDFSFGHGIGGVTVQDEYGAEMTLAEFLDLVYEDESDLSAIGKRFS